MPIFQKWKLRHPDLSHATGTQVESSIFLPDTQVWMNLVPVPSPATMLLCLHPKGASRRCHCALRAGAGILVAHSPCGCRVGPRAPVRRPY